MALEGAFCIMANVGSSDFLTLPILGIRSWPLFLTFFLMRLLGVRQLYLNAVLNR